MTRVTAIALLLFAAITAFADDKSDLKAMNGTWLPEKMEIEGTDFMDTFKGATVVIDNGKYVTTIGDMKDAGTITIDSTKMPKTMDLLGTDGVNKGKTFLCIYELKDGQITICYGLDDKVRPTKFESAKDSKTMLAVYKLKK